MYLVTVNVKNEQYNGTFSFRNLDEAAKKIGASIWANMSRDGVKQNLLNNGINKGETVTVWCESERLSHCSVKPV